MSWLTPGGGVGGGGGNSNSNSSEAQFYEKLFRYFDTNGYGFVQGNQVFGLFLSSGLNKIALGDIWDEATQKQSGGLNLNKFTNTLKLISLAQKGIKPTLQNIQNQPSVSIPKMNYPQQIEIPKAKAKDIKKPVDAFASLTSGFGFKSSTASLTDNNNDDVPKGNGVSGGPSAPNWGDDLLGGKDDVDNSDDMNNMMVDNNQLTPSGLGPLPQDNMLNIPSPHIHQHVNEYAPSSHMTSHSTTLTSTIVVPTTSSDIVGAVAPPGLNRRISTKILYQEERMREQLRQAEEREKLAKKQANTQRIENERLERENEQLKYEINEARKAQADALKQSQQALTSINPLQIENNKLKQAINQWKELIQTKDEELEQLETEVDTLRLENEKLENILTADKSKTDEYQFKLQRSDALLKELRDKQLNYENTINTLKQTSANLEDDKRILDLKVAELKSEIKKLKRNQHENSKYDQQTLQKKEADLFGSFDNNFGLKKVQKDIKKVQNDNDDIIDDDDDDNDGIMPPGSHDFNFNDDKVDKINKKDNILNMMNGEKSSDDDDDDDDDDDNNEPEYIDFEYDEKVEVITDKTIQILFDDKYSTSQWYLSSSECSSYHKYFLSADLNKDGVISGAEANKFFSKSKLNRKLLAKIWILVDQNKSGSLTEAMFCAMFHIVMKIKKSGDKLTVPQELPECLTVDVINKLGTKTTKIIKDKTWITQKKIKKIKNPKFKKKKKKKLNNKKKKINNDNNINNNDWGNDFSFDTSPSIQTTSNNKNNDNPGTNNKNEKVGNQQPDDENWDAFGSFFDQ